jgi:uncharacterized protein
MSFYFRSYNSYLQEIFHTRVYKISIDGGFTCPNRDGTKGVGGCIYCDERGSSSRTHLPKTSIRDQVIKNIAIRKSRYKAKKFIAYFQSYSNTYAPVLQLKKCYDEALFSSDDIVGLALSTRADCIDEEKLSLIASYQKIVPYVQIEYGLQTIHNSTLQRLNRCEQYEDFLQALEWTKQWKIHHCVHIILGLPFEEREKERQTAKALAKLGIEGVKIHFLVAMENTFLAKQYQEGLWQPLSFEEHISRACDFLEYLPPQTIIHRISGNGHPLHLVAPLWMKEKKEQILSSIEEEFKKRNTRQGFRYVQE